MSELIRPTASGAIWIVRHGLLKGAAVCTLIPSDPGRNCASKLAGTQGQQGHARIVDQRGFVDADVQTALLPEGHRRVRIINFASGASAIDVFVAIELAAWRPPCLGIAADR